MILLSIQQNHSLRYRSYMPQRSRVCALPATQRGVVLFIALIVLVAMTLAGIGLMRSVDTGTLLAGNLAFKQGSVQAGDIGTEEARAWLLAPTSSLDADYSTAGYYATRQDGLDLNGNMSPGTPANDVDWDGKNGLSSTKAKILAPDNAGNIVAYIINRMCTQPLGANDPGNDCAKSGVSGGGKPQDVVHYGEGALPSKDVTYYRITTRIAGPKDTFTYIQTMIII